MNHSAILKQVDSYYTGKVVEHGTTPRGVDWNSSTSQELRFQQLLRVCDGQPSFSLLDFGCGYGALLEYLRMRGLACHFTGYDISQTMIVRALSLHGGDATCFFTRQEADLSPCDFVVASGIFNVKLETSVDDWQAYVLDTIERMAQLSKAGFAFNMLTSYSDRERMRNDLYYGDPCFFFHHCKTRYSRHVALLHDYGLYEFTILVRR